MSIPGFVWSEPKKNADLKSITEVNQKSKSDDLDIIYKGNYYLLDAFGFERGMESFTSSSPKYGYSFLTSKRFPNSRLLGYRILGQRVGHMVALITRGDHVEYYDPTGDKNETLPDEIRSAIMRGGVMLKDVDSFVHQENNKICVRYSLYRATFGNRLDNTAFNELLNTKRTEYGLPTIADVIWNSSQNTFIDLGDDIAELYVLYL
jgi:hypothetical protein